MKYSSIFSMLSFFLYYLPVMRQLFTVLMKTLFFMRYVEKLHLDKYSVKKYGKN